MNLRECFERIDAEAWVNGLGLNGWLYRPLHPEDDQAWIETLLGVLAGTVTYRLIFDKKLKDEAFVDAAELLDLVPEPDSKALKEEFNQSLRGAHDRNVVLVQDMKRRLSSLRERSSFQEIAAMSLEITDDLARLEKISKPPRDLSVISIKTYCQTFLNKVRDKDDEVIFLEEEITRLESGLLKRSFSMLDAIMFQLKPIVLNGPADSRDLVERCFLALPELVLTGQTDTLEQIHQSLQENNLHKLNDVPMRSLPAAKRTTVEDLFGRAQREDKRPIIPSDMPLRAITRQFYYDKLPLLEGMFDDSKAVKDFIDIQLRISKTTKEAADWLLRGAKTILAKWNQNDLSMHAKGLSELAQHLLNIRKYTHAFDVFLDSFRLFVLAREDENTISSDETWAVTGAILADFIPRMVGRRQDADMWSMIQPIMREPAIILERLVRSDEIGALFRVFDELDEYENMRVFLNFLKDNWPVVDWASIIMERVLQARLFLRDTHKGVIRLKALAGEDYPDAAMARVLQALEVAAELGEEISRIDLKELEQAIAEFRKSTEPSAHERESLGILCEGLETIAESVRARHSVADEVHFSFRPIDPVFYLEERSIDLELIAVISLQGNSLPIHSFAVEIRFEESQKGKTQPYVTLHGAREELGFLEPGTNKEIIFRLDIDRKVLDNLSAIALNFQYFDGLTAIEPLDRKHTFQIDLKLSRKGSRFNPFVPGGALERQGLYVGREHELNKIKDTLIGQTQDNIPLVLGIRRIGKTSLLKRLVADEEIQRRYVTVLFDFEDMPESDTTADLLKRLCSTIHSEIGEKWRVGFLRANFDDDPLDAFFSYFKKFSQLPSSKRVLLLLDECEKLMSNIDKWRERLEASKVLADPRSALIPEVLGTIRKAMLHADRFSFVICGLPSIFGSIREYESRWFGLMTPIIIEPLTESEARELIQPAGRIPYKVSSEAIEVILYMTGRQPYLIQLICWNLFNVMLSSGRETAARKDVEEILQREILPHEAYFADYRTLIGDDIDVLRAIAVARGRLGHRRRFVAIDSIADQLRTSGHPIHKDELQSRLQQMEKAERPLVERNPNRSNSYKIVIGLLERLLEEEWA